MRDTISTKDVENIVRTGTTTVACIGKDGVVLAADKQSTAFYVSSRAERKIHKIGDHVGMTIAGSVGDAQYLVRILRAEASLFKTMRGREISPKSVSTLLANVMHGMRYYPFMTMLLMGGYDPQNGGEIYSIDPIGGISTGEGYFGSGSGSPMALGIMEAEYKDDMPIDDCVKLCIKSIKSARARDVYTGGWGLIVAIIDKDGYREVPEDEVNKLLK